MSTLLWFDLSNRFVWIVLLVTLGFGAIGWADDWRKVVHKDPEGMRSREKYFWQSVIGLWLRSTSCSASPRVPTCGWWSCSSAGSVGLRRQPAAQGGPAGALLQGSEYPLGVFGFVILTYLVIVGSSNAVNLTDGLDGLASCRW